MIYHIEGSPEICEEKNSTARTNSQGRLSQMSWTPENRPLSIYKYVVTIQTVETHSATSNNRDMEMALKLLKIVSFLEEGVFYCLYETGCNSPGGHGAIYSGDDTWADNIKKPLEEACRGDVKRQVGDFM